MPKLVEVEEARSGVKSEKGAKKVELKDG